MLKTLISFFSESNNVTYFTFDNILSVIAIVFSVVALITSIWLNLKALKITRDHNVKSIMPIINIDRDFDIKYGHKFSLSLTNSGFGVAILKNIVFTSGEISTSDLRFYLRKYLGNEKFNQVKDVIPFGSFSGVKALGVGEELIIFNILLTQNLESNELNFALGYLKCNVKYEDIYGNVYQNELSPQISFFKKD